MKVEKINCKTYKLLKLHLLKSQTYLKKINDDNFDDSLNIIIEQIEVHFRKALKIIYEYHCNHRKILFIGFPKLKKFSNLLIHTKHTFISQKIWINGLLCNNSSILRFLQINKLNNTSNKKNLSLKSINTCLEITNKPDLIVIFDSDFKKNIVKESRNFDIPIVFFGTNLYSNSQITYKIPGEYRFVLKKIKNISTLLLYSVLKRPLKKLKHYKIRNQNVKFLKREFTIDKERLQKELLNYIKNA